MLRQTQHSVVEKGYQELPFLNEPLMIYMRQYWPFIFVYDSHDCVRNTPNVGVVIDEQVALQIALYLYRVSNVYSYQLLSPETCARSVTLVALPPIHRVWRHRYDSPWRACGPPYSWRLKYLSSDTLFGPPSYRCRYTRGHETDVINKDSYWNNYRRFGSAIRLHPQVTKPLNYLTEENIDTTTTGIFVWSKETLKGVYSRLYHIKAYVTHVLQKCIVAAIQLLTCF